MSPAAGSSRSMSQNTRLSAVSTTSISNSQATPRHLGAVQVSSTVKIDLSAGHDPKHPLPLEASELLREVQATTRGETTPLHIDELILRGRTLGDTAFASVVDVIGRAKGQLKLVNMAFTRCGSSYASSIVACSEGDESRAGHGEISVKSTLRTLDLSFCRIGVQAMPGIARSLSSVTSRLRSLVLRYNPITAQGLGLLLKWGLSLSHIDCRCCGIMSHAEGRESGLAFVLEGLRENTVCSRLELEGNGFSGVEQQRVFEELAHNKRSAFTPGGVTFADPRADEVLRSECPNLNRYLAWGDAHNVEAALASYLTPDGEVSAWIGAEYTFNPTLEPAVVSEITLLDSLFLRRKAPIIAAPSTQILNKASAGAASASSEEISRPLSAWVGGVRGGGNQPIEAGAGGDADTSGLSLLSSVPPTAEAEIVNVVVPQVAAHPPPPLASTASATNTTHNTSSSTTSLTFATPQQQRNPYRGYGEDVYSGGGGVQRVVEAPVPRTLEPSPYRSRSLSQREVSQSVGTQEGGGGSQQRRRDRVTPALLNACMSGDAACKALIGSALFAHLPSESGSDAEGLPKELVPCCGIPDVLNQLRLGSDERVTGIAKLLHIILSAPCNIRSDQEQDILQEAGHVVAHKASEVYRRNSARDDYEHKRRDENCKARSLLRVLRKRLRKQAAVYDPSAEDVAPQDLPIVRSLSKRRAGGASTQHHDATPVRQKTRSYSTPRQSVERHGRVRSTPRRPARSTVYGDDRGDRRSQSRGRKAPMQASTPTRGLQMTTPQRSSSQPTTRRASVARKPALDTSYPDTTPYLHSASYKPPRASRYVGGGGMSFQRPATSGRI